MMLVVLVPPLSRLLREMSCKCLEKCFKVCNLVLVKLKVVPLVVIVLVNVVLKLVVYNLCGKAVKLVFSKAVNLVGKADWKAVSMLCLLLVSIETLVVHLESVGLDLI